MGQQRSAASVEHHRQQVRDVKGRFAGGWGYEWTGLEATAAEINQWADNFVNDVFQNAERLKDEMVAWAKENAVWQDHPGVHEDARDNLQGHVTKTGPASFTILIGHGARVYYGVFLEYSFGGRYAILAPTIEHFSPLAAGKLTSR